MVSMAEKDGAKSCPRTFSWGRTGEGMEELRESNVLYVPMQGVLSLKKSHFEPRYILTAPLNPQVRLGGWS